MNLSFPNSMTTAGDTSNLAVGDERKPQRPQGSAARQGGLLTAPRSRSEVAIGSGGGYPMIPTPRVQGFVTNVVDDLRLAAQSGNRYPLPALPSGSADSQYEQMTDHAVRQYDRLLRQLGPDVQPRT